MTRVSTLILSVAIVAAPALASPPEAGPPSGRGVQPVSVEGNPRCSDYDLEGCKIDPPNGGTYECSGVDVSINPTQGSTLSWESEAAWELVIVKGGPAANLFRYVPAEISDTLLHAPIGPSGGFYGLSHVNFCGPGDPPTTTGSCCIDGECSEDRTRARCEEAGGTYGGDGSTCDEIVCSTSVPTLPAGALAILLLVLLIGGAIVLARRLQIQLTLGGK
jgi:hypothetical protein